MGIEELDAFEIATARVQGIIEDAKHGVEQGLNKQDRLLLRFVLLQSWRRIPEKRSAAYLGDLGEVARLSHIKWKSHTSESIDRLVEKNVLVPLTAFQPKFRGWYAINHKFDEWDVVLKPPVHVHEEQDELKFPDELKRLLTENFIESSLKKGAKSFLPIRVVGTSHGSTHATNDPADAQRPGNEGSSSNGGSAIRGQSSQTVKPASECSSPPVPASFQGHLPPAGGGAQGEVAHEADSIAAAIARLSASFTIPKKGMAGQTDEAAAVPNFGMEGAAPVTEAIPKKGMEPQNLNAGGTTAGVPKIGMAQALPSPPAEKVSPPVPPSSKPNETIESNSSLEAVPKKGKADKPFRAPGAGETSDPADEDRPPARVSWSEEFRLMERIAEFVGADKRCEHEMAQSGAFWRERVVRAFPAQVDEAVSTGRMLASTNYLFTENRAAWLMGKIARLTGKKSLGGCPRRARPVQ
jgi:hypothetical protein